MKNIINFIKNLFCFKNQEESMIGLSSFKTLKNDYYFSATKSTRPNNEPSLSALLTKKQFQ